MFLPQESLITIKLFVSVATRLDNYNVQQYKHTVYFPFSPIVK